MSKEHTTNISSDNIKVLPGIYFKFKILSTVLQFEQSTQYKITFHQGLFKNKETSKELGEFIFNFKTGVPSPPKLPQPTPPPLSPTPEQGASPTASSAATVATDTSSSTSSSSQEKGQGKEVTGSSTPAATPPPPPPEAGQQQITSPSAGTSEQLLPQSQQQLSPPPAEEQVELKTLLELNNFNDAERSKYVEKLIKDELNTNNFTEIEPSLKQKEKKRPTNQKRKKGKVEYDEYVGCDKDIDTNKYCIKSTKDKLEIRTNTNQKDVIKEIIKPVIDSLKIIEEGDHTYNTLNYTYMT